MSLVRENLGHRPLIAARWQRLLAWFIDGAIARALAAGLFAVTDHREVVVATVAAYFVVLTALVGQTVGKMVVGIRVVSRTTRHVPSWPSNTARWAAVGWLFVVPFPNATVARVAVLAWLTIVGPVSWNRDGRGIHDRVGWHHRHPSPMTTRRTGVGGPVGLERFAGVSRPGVSRRSGDLAGISRLGTTRRVAPLLVLLLPVCYRDRLAAHASTSERLHSRHRDLATIGCGKSV